MSEITILDGGMGKELRRIGAPFRQPEWSSLALMEAPDMVLKAHCNFIDAGARVITTNNYAVVPYHHTPEFFDARGAELTAFAGRLARVAADDAQSTSGVTVEVAGSLPPLFGSYEPERFDRGRAEPVYAAIANALDPFVDIWLAETLSTIDEMLTIVDAVRNLGTTRPIWISFSVPDAWEDGAIALRSGETMRAVVDAVAESALPVDALLVNCSLPERTGPALAELHAAIAKHQLDIRTGGYANAFPHVGGSGYAANQVIYERRPELTADHYAEFVAGWVDRGASVIGGCCDMYPEHIAALAKRFS